MPLAFGCTTKNEIVAPSAPGGADIIQAMAEVGMPLLIHGEVTTAGVDIFDKEARFIEEVIKVFRRGVHATVVATASGHKTSFLVYLLNLSLTLVSGSIQRYLTITRDAVASTAVDATIDT